MVTYQRGSVKYKKAKEKYLSEKTDREIRMQNKKGIIASKYIPSGMWYEYQKALEEKKSKVEAYKTALKKYKEKYPVTYQTLIKSRSSQPKKIAYIPSQQELELLSKLEQEQASYGKRWQQVKEYAEYQSPQDEYRIKEEFLESYRNKVNELKEKLREARHAREIDLLRQYEREEKMKSLKSRSIGKNIELSEKAKFIITAGKRGIIKDTSLLKSEQQFSQVYRGNEKLLVSRKSRRELKKQGYQIPLPKESISKGREIERVKIEDLPRQKYYIVKINDKERFISEKSYKKLLKQQVKGKQILEEKKQSMFPLIYYTSDKEGKLKFIMKPFLLQIEEQAEKLEYVGKVYPTIMEATQPTSIMYNYEGIFKKLKELKNEKTFIGKIAETKLGKLSFGETKTKVEEMQELSKGQEWAKVTKIKNIPEQLKHEALSKEEINKWKLEYYKGFEIQAKKDIEKNYMKFLVSVGIGGLFAGGSLIAQSSSITSTAFDIISYGLLGSYVYEKGKEGKKVVKDYLEKEKEPLLAGAEAEKFIIGIGTEIVGFSVGAKGVSTTYKSYKYATTPKVVDTKFKIKEGIFTKMKEKPYTKGEQKVRYEVTIQSPLDKVLGKKKVVTLEAKPTTYVFEKGKITYGFSEANAIILDDAVIKKQRFPKIQYNIQKVKNILSGDIVIKFIPKNKQIEKMPVVSKKTNTKFKEIEYKDYIDTNARIISEQEKSIKLAQTFRIVKGEETKIFTRTKTEYEGKFKEFVSNGFIDEYNENLFSIVAVSSETRLTPNWKSSFEMKKPIKSHSKSIILTSKPITSPENTWSSVFVKGFGQTVKPKKELGKFVKEFEVKELEYEPLPSIKVGKEGVRKPLLKELQKIYKRKKSKNERLKLKRKKKAKLEIYEPSSFFLNAIKETLQPSVYLKKSFIFPVKEIYKEKELFEKNYIIPKPITTEKVREKQRIFTSEIPIQKQFLKERQKEEEQEQIIDVFDKTSEILDIFIEQRATIKPIVTPISITEPQKPIDEEIPVFDIPIPIEPEPEKKREAGKLSFIFEFHKKSKDNKKKQVYDTYVKSKGKFMKVNENPLTKTSALGLGARIVDNTASASFKIKKAKKRIGDKRIGYNIDWFGLSHKFRKKKDVYIEKEQDRIDTIGELQGITVKGLLALERERNLNFGGVKKWF